MKLPLRPLLVLTALFQVVAFAACPQNAAGGGGGPPSTQDAAPVEKAVRDLYTGYTTASTGDQARTALETSGTAAFVDGLKAKASACSTAAASGKPDPSCDADPVICTTAKVSVTAVVVQSVNGKTGAVASAVLTPEGGGPAVNTRVTLVGDGTAWKVQAIECPK